VRGPVTPQVELSECHPACGVLLIPLVEVDHRHHGLAPARQVQPPGDLGLFLHGVRAEPDGEVGERA